MSGAKHRRKGDRVEREIVEMLKAVGIHAERFPYSGATRFRGEGHDLDVYLFGKNSPPVKFEVKARKDGAGFKMMGKWCGESDGLLLKENNKKPGAYLTWDLILEIAARLKKLDELEKKEARNALRGLARPVVPRD